MTTIQDLRKKPHLSVSGINDYVECSLLYKLGRVDRVAPEYVSDALLFGKCIHKVLEKFYINKRTGRETPLAYLLEQFTNFWLKAKEDNENIQFKEGESFETLLQKGRGILTVYYKELPADNFKVVATELPFSFALDGLDVPVIGVMDLVEEDDGGNIIITDWKTSSRAYSKDEVKKSFQLTVYQIAARQNGFADLEILLKFDCLIKTRKPKFEQYYTIRTEQDEQRAVKKILHVWDGIQKGVFIPNDTSWKCGYCAFKDHCDKWFQEKEVV